MYLESTLFEELKKKLLTDETWEGPCPKGFSYEFVHYFTLNLTSKSEVRMRVCCSRREFGGISYKLSINEIEIDNEENFPKELYETVKEKVRDKEERELGENLENLLKLSITGNQ